MAHVMLAVALALVALFASATVRAQTVNATHGWMQASAANGFMNTSSTDCSGTPYNFQPEYNTAAKMA